MDWYFPITLLPAVGLLIMSTTAQMMNLSAEIGSILQQKSTPLLHKVSDMKIRQLGRLTKSVTLLYVSAAFFTLSGLMGAILEKDMLSELSRYILIAGVILVLTALILLILYGFQTIRIRKLQHTHNHKMEKIRE